MAGLNRLYYPKRYTSRAQVIALGVKCVFISYQKKDREAAVKVAEYLQAAGIDVYIDVYDSELRIQHQNDNPKEVTKAICNGINNSSHMLVLVSPSTMFSTWVPFEIGYDKTDLGVLCLKGIPKGKLPEYARTATIVRDIYDLNSLIEKLSGKKKELLLETKMMSDYNSASNPLLNVMDNLINDTY
ncbi:toll/interleukin-1 receptor domain-containing protein [Sphingobacterium kitahiroshimense]|uniref:toll/interleukin-1 receptor domain-containing protein n=1 Tax=Sphingobacterium kitahiroshimense TaxID=470446 RepID=UPI00320AA973